MLSVTCGYAYFCSMPYFNNGSIDLANKTIYYPLTEKAQFFLCISTADIHRRTTCFSNLNVTEALLHPEASKKIFFDVVEL